MVIPVTEVTRNAVKDSAYDGSYTRGLREGAYVFGVSPESGFSLKGIVTHSEDSGTSYYYMTGNRVRRSLFMDDILYTISNEKIVASSLDNPADIISQVELPGTPDYPYYYV